MFTQHARRLVSGMTRGRAAAGVVALTAVAAGGAAAVHADYRGEPSTVPEDKRFMNPELERAARGTPDPNKTRLAHQQMDNEPHSVGGSASGTNEAPAMGSGTRGDFRTSMSGSTRQTHHSVHSDNVPNWYSSTHEAPSSSASAYSAARDQPPPSASAHTAAAAAAAAAAPSFSATPTVVGPAGDVHTGAPVVDVPGSPISFATRAADVTAGLLQSFRPVNGVREHLGDVLHYRGQPARQLAVHEYVTHLSEDFGQVLLFDADTTDARLVGVQYVISESLYATLPPDEQAMWSSMAFAVKSGVVVAPGVPSFAEHQLMGRLANSYAKSWLFWHVDQGHAVPLGAPDLLEPYTDPSQVDRTLLDVRDDVLGVSSTQRRDQRKDLAVATA